MKKKLVSRKYWIISLLSILLFVTSLFLYFFAPSYYSHSYCNLLLFFFVISSIISIRSSILNSNFLTFHFLFVISFFFVNFVYPVFLYPISITYFPVYRLKFNHDIITKATALALVGFNSFTLGVVSQVRKSPSYISIRNLNYNTLYVIIKFFLCILFVGVLFFGGHSLLSGQFGSTSHIPSGYLLIFQIVLGLAVLLTFYIRKFSGSMVNFFVHFDKLTFLFLFLFSLIFIFTGDRGPVIQIMLISLVSFTMFVKPMKFKRFLIVVLLGMFFLTFLSYARTQTYVTKGDTESGVTFSKGLKYVKIHSVFDIGMDLIVTNRNLYTGYDYVDKHGFNYGKSMSYYIFAPFPMLPSLFSHALFNSNPEDLTSANILTKDSNARYGLGTNMIIDLFMMYGIFGVILFMFILGYVVTRFQRLAILGNRFNYIIAYVFLVSLSIYLPRSTVMEPLRLIVWAIMFFEFIKGLRLLLLQLSKKNM